MTTPPQPEITVTKTEGDTGRKAYTVTATRDGKSHAWSGEGGTTAGAIKQVVEKMLGDPRTAEYIKR